MHYAILNVSRILDRSLALSLFTFQSPLHSPPLEPYKKKCANFEGEKKLRIDAEDADDDVDNELNGSLR